MKFTLPDVTICPGFKKFIFSSDLWIVSMIKITVLINQSPSYGSSSLGILRGRFIFTKVQVIHSVEIYEESAVPS